MEKEIIQIDKEKGIFRITTLGERWYAKPSKSKKTGLPEFKFYPSSTWISGYYPKGIGFMKWLASKGWDEAEALKVAAGDKGSRVHYACADLAKGLEVKMNSEYPNKTAEREALSVEEYICVQSFANWLDSVQPEILAVEITLFNREYNYAGTIDYVMRFNNQIWLVDLKTSQNLYPDHELQISSYSHLDFDKIALDVTEDEWNSKKLGILRLGYLRNKNGFRFVEVEDKFNLFLNTKEIWANENINAEPEQIEYPLSLQMKTDKNKILGIKVAKEKLKKLTK